MKTLLAMPDRPRFGKALTTGCGSLFAAVLLTSCVSTKYDMRQLQSPVVLNDNPLLAPGNASSLNLRNVDTYEAATGFSNVAGGNTSTTAVKNDAQTKAFVKLAGQRRVIRNLSLKVDYLAINGLVALGDTISIDAKGDVAEFQAK